MSLLDTLDPQIREILIRIDIGNPDANWKVVLGYDQKQSPHDNLRRIRQEIGRIAPAYFSGSDPRLKLYIAQSYEKASMIFRQVEAKLLPKNEPIGTLSSEDISELSHNDNVARTAIADKKPFLLPTSKGVTVAFPIPLDLDLENMLNRIGIRTAHSQLGEETEYGFRVRSESLESIIHLLPENLGGHLRRELDLNLLKSTTDNNKKFEIARGAPRINIALESQSDIDRLNHALRRLGVSFESNEREITISPDDGWNNLFRELGSRNLPDVPPPTKMVAQVIKADKPLNAANLSSPDQPQR